MAKDECRRRAPAFPVAYLLVVVAVQARWTVCRVAAAAVAAAVDDVRRSK